MRYETLILTVPELLNDEAAAIESALAKVVNDEKGGVLSFERWGKFRLSYPVKRNDYGIYLLFRFEIDAARSGSLVRAVENLLAVKYNESVMRFMTTALDDRQSLDYQRPESLEEAPRESGYFRDDRQAYGPSHDNRHEALS